MFTYEANITCSTPDCEAIATGDTCDSPDMAQKTAEAQAIQNGWCVLANGNAYCPHHLAEARLCPEKHPPSGCPPRNEFLTPRQTDLIHELVRCMFAASLVNRQPMTPEDVFALADELLNQSALKSILCDLTKYPNT